MRMAFWSLPKIHTGQASRQHKKILNLLWSIAIDPEARCLARSAGIVQAFKSISTHAYITGVKQHGWQPFPGKLWERDYYERVIRDDAALEEIRTYIANNPMR